MTFTVYQMKYKGAGAGGYCLGRDAVTHFEQVDCYDVSEAMQAFNDAVEINDDGFYDRIVLIENEPFTAYEDWNIVAEREW